MDLTTLTSTPTASAQIGDTKLYIYGPSTSDIAKLKALAEADAQTAFKVLVGLICSEIDITGKQRAELPKLSDSKIDTLVERADELARALLDSAFLRWISMDAERPPRTATEDDVQYLMRSVQHYIESQRDHTRALFASLSGSDSSRFKELHRVTESLRSLADLNAPFVQQRRERARELTAQEQTAAMTAKSSEALVKLIETTAIFIDEFDRRSQVADKTTAHQIVLAKRGIYVSAVLAGIALLLSGAALWQDWSNNAANDKWQDQVLSTVKAEIERSKLGNAFDANSVVAKPLQLETKKGHIQGQ